MGAPSLPPPGRRLACAPVLLAGPEGPLRLAPAQLQRGELLGIQLEVARHVLQRMAQPEPLPSQRGDIAHRRHHRAGGGAGCTGATARSQPEHGHIRSHVTAV